jgi:hypothetical protein
MMVTLIPSRVGRIGPLLGGTIEIYYCGKDGEVESNLTRIHAKILTKT